MSMVAGYTVLFGVRGGIRQVTFAIPDDHAIDLMLFADFEASEVLARTPLDAKALALLNLQPGEWIEWITVRKKLDVRRR